METKIIVALVGAAATVTAALITVLLRRDKGTPTLPTGIDAERQIPPQQQTGRGNFQAGRNITVGRDLTVFSQAERTEGVLEVTNVGFTHESEFDVMVRNLGDTDVIIHTITIKKAGDPQMGVLPILNPTAKYHIPVDDIPVGKSKSLSVSHLVPARNADRFLIALETTSVYLLEVTLHYNKDSVISFSKRTW
jgi:hypothetical protein